MKNVVKIVSLVLVCVAFICVCTSCAQSKQAENPPEFTLYCGLNDADAGKQVLTVDEAKGMARAIIIDNGCGYTEFVAHGGYQSGDAVIGNDTLVYEIYFADAVTVEKITKEIQAELNLMPILVSEGTSSYHFSE
ncbi:MAG: hypothetical protein IJC37_06195 [Clostridia bacterium]|nr:hypothetical protein [Clostridia bacterium]